MECLRSRLRAESGSASEGWTLLDTVLGLALMAAILLGVMASLSMAFEGSRSSAQNVDSQLLLSRVLEEVQASPFDTLLSFNGVFVVEGDHRADIRVVQVDNSLVQIQVDVGSQVFPDVASRGVLLVADTQ